MSETKKVKVFVVGPPNTGKGFIAEKLRQALESVGMIAVLYEDPELPGEYGKKFQQDVKEATQVPPHMQAMPVTIEVVHEGKGASEFCAKLGLPTSLEKTDMLVDVYRLLSTLDAYQNKAAFDEVYGRLRTRFIPMDKL